MKGIYQILAKGGRRYVGQAIDIQARWSRHKSELNWAQARGIKSKLRLGRAARASIKNLHELLAEEYDVSKYTIKNIDRGHRWANDPGKS